MYYIKTAGLEERTRLLEYLKDNGVTAVFHYVPLHSSAGGQKYGRFHGEDRYTTAESERVVRLPMYYGLTEDEITYVTELIGAFYSQR